MNPSEPARRAVFLSYASQDAPAVAVIAAALRADGIEVWFDQDELRGGDAWDQKIRRQIRECALFVPLISANAQARPEGYFRLEWRLAELRSQLIAHGRPFIVPVAIDETNENDALVPEAFLGVQWTRMQSDDALPAFASQVSRLLQRLGGSAAPGGIARPEPGTRDTRPPAIPDFELLNIIGRGSYGDVWLARGLTGVYRAIKIVWRDRFVDAEPFEREFKGLKKFTTMSLPEASQLALLHVGQNTAAGFFYYVMELADDVETGREVNPAKYAPLTLREMRTRRGRLPAGECVKIGIELARVVAGLHARGLVHRDIKPANVILVGGVPKLADIGLVAATDDALTYVGTEGFVPPEGPGKPAADVYALGRLFYELATGLDREEFPRLPSELDKLSDRKLLFAFNEIILKACEPAPEKRYRDAAAMLADLLALQAGRSRRRRQFRGLGLGLAAAAMAAGAVVVARHWPAPPVPLPVPPVAAAPALGDKSVAVLPFTNLSEEKDAVTFFSDGVHEDIITSLGLIRELRVVSRTSVMHYRNTTKPAGEIGRELGVMYLLEGTVRRLGNKVRVTAQLIDARTDQQAWAQTYDRDLTDIFAIQSDIAQAIAVALQAAISPQEKNRLAARPTASATAYDLYLRARAIKHATMNSLPDAEPLLLSAIQIDPHFAAAWAELSYVHVSNYYQGRAADQLAAAKAAIEKAVQLGPDDPEVVQCLGDYYFYGYRDYLRATEQYLRLLQLRPNDADMHFSLGLMLRRQGRWVEAVAAMDKAQQIEPGNRRYAWAHIGSLLFIRRFPEAERLARRMFQEYPGDARSVWQLALVTFWARGSQLEAGPLKTRSFDPDQAEVVEEYRRMLAAAFGDWAEYLRLDQERRARKETPDWEGNVALALVLADSGDRPAAMIPAKEAQKMLLEEIKNDPTVPRLWANLGVMYAVQGEKAEALRCADKAVELCPTPHDAIDYPEIVLARVSVLARLGESDQALAELAPLFRVPAGPNVHMVRMGIGHGISFQPLRGNPRFEALLDDPQNNAPLF